MNQQWVIFVYFVVKIISIQNIIVIKVKIHLTADANDNLVKNYELNYSIRWWVGSYNMFVGTILQKTTSRFSTVVANVNVRMFKKLAIKNVTETY